MCWLPSPEGVPHGGRVRYFLANLICSRWCLWSFVSLQADSCNNGACVHSPVECSSGQAADAADAGSESGSAPVATVAVGVVLCVCLVVVLIVLRRCKRSEEVKHVSPQSYFDSYEAPGHQSTGAVTFCVFSGTDGLQGCCSDSREHLFRICVSLLSICTSLDYLDRYLIRCRLRDG
jgi:hypothetical protein